MTKRRELWVKRLLEKVMNDLACDINDLVKRHVARVLHMLDLLAIPRGLLERLQNQCGGGGYNKDSGDAVLANELASHTHALVVLRCLGDVITNLLGGLLKDTKRTSQLRNLTLPCLPHSHCPSLHSGN